MFEYLFEKRLASAIAAKVVDDTEDFIIPVGVLPQGRAVILDIALPSEFIPYVPFYIKIHLRNDGADDKIFARIINRDTGDIIVTSGEAPTLPGVDFYFNLRVTLTQTTDFHGRIEAGHVE